MEQKLSINWLTTTILHSFTELHTTIVDCNEVLATTHIVVGSPILILNKNLVLLRKKKLLIEADYYAIAAR